MIFMFQDANGERSYMSIEDDRPLWRVAKLPSNRYWFGAAAFDEKLLHSPETVDYERVQDLNGFVWYREVRARP